MVSYIEIKIEEIFRQYQLEYCQWMPNRDGGGYYCELGRFIENTEAALDKKFKNPQEAKIYFLSKIIKVANDLIEKNQQ